MKRIAERIDPPSAALQAFVERLLTDDVFFDLAATDIEAALRHAGLPRSERGLNNKEWSGLIKSLSALRFAQSQEATGVAESPAETVATELKTGAQIHRAVDSEVSFAGRRGDISRLDVFNAVFGLGETVSPVAGEDTGTHTGYNEGWSNSSHSTATTESGTHRIFSKEMNVPLMYPAEAVLVAKKTGVLARLFAAPAR